MLFQRLQEYALIAINAENATRGIWRAGKVTREKSNTSCKAEIWMATSGEYRGSAVMK